MSEAARQMPKAQIFTAKAYSAQSAPSGTALFITQRAVRPRDVQIDVLCYRICHSGLHQVHRQKQYLKEMRAGNLPGENAAELSRRDECE
jgi:hypothetical protein